MHPIGIGTCGWSYKDRAGTFYPEGCGPGDYLTHYATRYPVVEVDSTFCRSPSVKMVQAGATRRWTASVSRSKCRNWESITSSTLQALFPKPSRTFAAMEQPHLLVDDVRTFFRRVR